MIIRQLKETQFEHLHNALIMKAHANDEQYAQAMEELKKAGESLCQK